jgi:polyhydroxyalkanoate synthesis regulator phasin
VLIVKIETDIKIGAIVFEKYELIAYLQARVAELEKQVAELKAKRSKKR